MNGVKNMLGDVKVSSSLWSFPSGFIIDIDNLNRTRPLRTTRNLNYLILLI